MVLSLRLPMVLNLGLMDEGRGASVVLLYIMN